MQRVVLFLLICLLVVYSAHAESNDDVYETTIRVHDALAQMMVRIADTGERDPDGQRENILRVEIFSQDGTQLQAFTYLSNEAPDYEGAAAMVMIKDLNFDGYQDLMLLTAAGARNVFHAIAIWDVEAGRFRPVEQACEWDRATGRFSDVLTQVELCNVELFPEERMLLSDEQDGFRFRRTIYFMFDGTYSLTPKFIWDVYDAGDEKIGEALTSFNTHVTLLWDERYPEEWYYGQDGVFDERRQAVRAIALQGALSAADRRLCVANVDWVNLRKQDSKASPSLAKLKAGEMVTLLVDDCGAEDGWVRVLYDLGENQGLTLDEYDTGRYTMTGYIWHSFLEPAP